MTLFSPTIIVILLGKSWDDASFIMIQKKNQVSIIITCNYFRTVYMSLVSAIVFCCIEPFISVYFQP